MATSAPAPILSEAARTRDSLGVSWKSLHIVSSGTGISSAAFLTADRPADAVTQFQKMKEPWNVVLAAAYARLGKLDEAHAIIAKLLIDRPSYTWKYEAEFPTTKQPQFVEPLLSRYLADLAKAGLPEK